MHLADICVPYSSKSRGFCPKNDGSRNEMEPNRSKTGEIYVFGDAKAPQSGALGSDFLTDYQPAGSNPVERRERRLMIRGPADRGSSRASLRNSRFLLTGDAAATAPALRGC